MVTSSRGEDTRLTIFHTALELFSRNGYDATGVAEICRQANVSKGAFYYHFPSKQDLFLALMAAWLEALDAAFQEAVASAEDVPHALEKMAEFSGNIFAELKSGFPILLAFWTQANRQPEVWERAVEPYQKYLTFFSEVVEDGKAEGAFAEGLGSEQSARLLMALAMGLLLQASFDPAGADWPEVTRSGINILMNGMR